MKSVANTQVRYWLLDAVAGWRETSRARLQLTSPDGNLILDPLPGTASLLLDADTQALEFKRPSALAADGSGNVLVTDAATSLVKRIDLERGSIQTLPAIGGRGRAPRELWEPHGIAALPSGAVVVSDAGNHHVKVFSAVAYALLQDWGAEDSMRRPGPGEAPGTFNRPWAVAVDARAAVYVADRGNRRIQKFFEDGSWQGEIDAGPLQSPARLAAGPGDRIAVVDVGSDAVVVTGAGSRQLLPGVDQPRSAAFDAEGRIYVGGRGGLIHVFVPDASAQSGYRNAGIGVTGLDGEIVDLIWHRAHGLIAVVHESSGGRRWRLWKIDPAGARARTGTFITQTLDSKIDLNCQWHRVLLDADVPAGTIIQIDSLTSPDPLSDREAIDSRQWNPCVRSGNCNPDCLIQSGPGRYLRLRLTFGSNGLKSPELRSLKVFYPRVTYLQYLPAVYQEDEESRLFLERFLSIFQSEFDNLDHRIDCLWQLFNPGSVRTEHLPWLAAWFAMFVDPDWPVSKLRSMVKGAFNACLVRGTVAGLKRAIRDYTGVETNIIEHFRLRRLPVLSGPDATQGSIRLWSREFYRRLQVGAYSQLGSFRLVSNPEPNLEAMAWGAHQFTVCFPANPYESEDIQRRVTQVIEREKPAHTQAIICPIFPRFRIGVQATIGADTVVGGISHLVLNRLSSLGYDSVLGSSRGEATLRGLGSTPHPAVGRSSCLW